MPDRGKVVQGLEYCEKYFSCCDKCPYWDGGTHCTADLAHDALALLKEQEAKPPAIMQDIECIWLTCSMCGHKLRPIFAMKMDTYFPKFCAECGQKVKWE